MLWPYFHAITPHVIFDKCWEKMAGIHKHQSYASQGNFLVEWMTPWPVSCFVLQELHKCKGQGFDFLLGWGSGSLRKPFDCWCTFDRWVGAWRTSKASGIPLYQCLSLTTCKHLQIAVFLFPWENERYLIVSLYLKLCWFTNRFTVFIV